MNDTFSKRPRAEQRLEWAKTWFKQFATFHRRHGQFNSWCFTPDNVTDFLRFKRDNKVPAWKRLKILEGIIEYSTEVLDRDPVELKPVLRKMKEIVEVVHAREQGYSSIEEAVGHINPKESDAIQEFRRAMRKSGLKLRTERSYVGKLRAFMKARGLTCLADFENISSRDVEAHLTDLAVDGNVAPSTQNAAFHALLKFFDLVLKREMGKIEAIRAKKDKYIPTILSTKEVAHVFDGLQGQHLIIAQLLYGCGMRISEAIRLRVKDLNFENSLIEIRQSKGDKSRTVPMPKELAGALKRQVAYRKSIHEQDIADGVASVWLPHALDQKFPSAHKEFRWQYLFASHRFSRDPRTKRHHRHHIHSDTFPCHLRRAVESAQIHKHVTSHTFRHCFATHLLRTGVDIRTIQHLLGHQDVATTMIYTHIVECEKVVSPLDRLLAPDESLASS